MPSIEARLPALTPLESRTPRYLASCVPAHASRWRWWDGSAGTQMPPPVAGHQEALEMPVPRPPPRVGHQAAARWLWRTAARTVSRTLATVGRPASAMSACFGVEMGRAYGDGPVRSAQLTVNFHVGRRDRRKSDRYRIFQSSAHVSVGDDAKWVLLSP